MRWRWWCWTLSTGSGQRSSPQSRSHSWTSNRTCKQQHSIRHEPASTLNMSPGNGAVVHAGEHRAGKHVMRTCTCWCHDIQSPVVSTYCVDADVQVGMFLRPLGAKPEYRQPFRQYVMYCRQRTVHAYRVVLCAVPHSSPTEDRLGKNLAYLAWL